MLTKILTLTLLISPLVSRGEPLHQNLLSCESSGGFLLTHCQFPTMDVAPDYCFSEHGSEVCTQMTLTVKYQFTCSGNPLPIGIKSESASQSFMPGAGVQTAQVKGIGPFALANFNPAVTDHAAVSNDCSLSLESVSMDLSTGSLALLEERLAQMREFNVWLDSAKKVESRSNTLQAILFQIDIPAIKTLLGSVKSRVVLLRDAYDDEEAKTKLGLVLASLDSATAAAPPPADAAAWRAGIQTNLEKLVEITGAVTTRLADREAELYVRSGQLIAYAAEATAEHYEPLFEAEHEKAKQFIEN